jgi:hypothetical protein
MRPSPRLLVALLLVVVGVGGPASPGLSSPGVDDLPADVRQVVDWAVGRFEAAGMELPALRVVYHGDDADPCAGYLGVHRQVDDVHRIELCTSLRGRVMEVLVLHEMAHAWIEREVGDDAREQFRQLRGWTHWRDHAAVAWHENGSEQAAEILAWGLLDRPMQVVRIHEASCEDLVVGYRTLTGVEPLNEC